MPKVPGMISVHDLKGAMRFDCSKDMSLHFQLAPIMTSVYYCQLCGGCSADKTCVFLHLVAEV